MVAAILNHLKATDVPKLDSTGRILSSHSACIRAVLSARRAKAERFKGLLDGLQDELWVLLSWLEFLAQNSAAFVALLPPDSGMAAYLGSISSADILGWSRQPGNTFKWTRAFCGHTNRPRRRRQEYRVVNFSLSQMFYARLSGPMIRNIFLEQINGFNRRSLERLAGSFIDHRKKGGREIWKGKEETRIQATRLPRLPRHGHPTHPQNRFPVSLRFCSTPGIQSLPCKPHWPSQNRYRKHRGRCSPPCHASCSRVRSSEGVANERNSSHHCSPFSKQVS
ncbi:hypothetical protein FA13DRAFT_1735309 [Coprinellus micaceus]|uniref:Uncharacterized protein n=1 Tax=Coprinellus micaceus TaxID=71717 RepID=A0A4Y7T4C4_COPMI|nr:hypothetical protein FA13DRAFT_1735309 [Coprinellus micaceus]